MVIVFCYCKIIVSVRNLFTLLKLFFVFVRFALKQNEQKIQDLETPAKNLKNFLKSPNSRLSFPNACSNSGYFLTEFFQIFLTPPFPRSFLQLFFLCHCEERSDEAISKR